QLPLGANEGGTEPATCSPVAKTRAPGGLRITGGPAELLAPPLCRPDKGPCVAPTGANKNGRAKLLDDLEEQQMTKTELKAFKAILKAGKSSWRRSCGSVTALRLKKRPMPWTKCNSPRNAIWRPAISNA